MRKERIIWLLIIGATIFASSYVLSPTAVKRESTKVYISVSRTSVSNIQTANFKVHTQEQDNRSQRNTAAINCRPMILSPSLLHQVTNDELNIHEGFKI